MSEFSDCFFLLDASHDQAVSLFSLVRRYGIVLPPANRYTPFLVDGACDAGSLIDTAIDHNPGIMLHYSYVEDHGLWLTAYDRTSSAFTIDIQRCGPSENDLDTILAQVEQLHLLPCDRLADLQDILAADAQEGMMDLSSIRTRLSQTLGIVFFQWLSCADLAVQSQKELSQRFPGAVFVSKSKRGQADKMIEPTPNEWCPRTGLPPLMYLPVPSGAVDEAMLERHVKHWLETHDWNESRDAGFWLYTAYCRALPNRMRYLANRIMNLTLAFGAERYEEKLRQTIEGVLTVADPAFDWEPYLNMRGGEQRL